MEWLSSSKDALTVTWQLAVLIVTIVSLLVAYKRVRTARLDNLQTRFQKGAEMFGSEVIATFLGGLYELQQLAKRYPKEYHVVVMKVLSAHVRNMMRAGNVTEDADLAVISDPRRELAEAVLRVIGDRSWRGKRQESKSGYRVKLSGVDARAMHLPDCDFSGIDARGALFSHATLDRAVLRGSQLVGAKFNGTRLQGADLSNSDLDFAYLTGADLSFGSLAGARLQWTEMPQSLYLCDLSDASMFEVRGLTQRTLDAADGRIRTLPSIVASLDPETSDELQWKGGNKDPVPHVMTAFGWKRTTSVAGRVLARLLPHRGPRRKVIASEEISDNMRLYAERVGRRAHSRKYVVYRWERGGGSSLHTKVYEGNSLDSAITALGELSAAQRAASSRSG